MPTTPGTRSQPTKKPSKSKAKPKAKKPRAKPRASPAVKAVKEAVSKLPPKPVPGGALAGDAQTIVIPVKPLTLQQQMEARAARDRANAAFYQRVVAPAPRGKRS